MGFYDPALVAAFFFAAGDREGERLWEVVSAAPPDGERGVRRKRISTAGTTIVQVALERTGYEEVGSWSDLSQAMAGWLGRFWDAPPDSFWGMSRIYLGAAVAGPYEEQALLAQGLSLAEEPSRPVVLLPVGRLWLASPPGMVDRGSVVATYAWFYAPTEEVRRRLEELLWDDGASFPRAELYLHRALHQLRQYGREERTAFWATLDRTENAAALALARPDARCLGQLREASRVTVRELARLSRRHNLLRSSAYLYRQIGQELRQEGDGLFYWYEQRLQEALVQWGYDLERADRAITLARTALLAVPPPEPAPEPVPPMGKDAPAIPFLHYLVAAAVFAFCLVDDNWMIVLARAGVLSLLAVLSWVWLRRQRR